MKCPADRRAGPGWLASILLAGIFLVVLTTAAGFAQEAGPFRFDTEGRWHIEADTLAYNKDRETYIARGDVVVTGADTRIRADEIHFDQRCQTLTAGGHVTLTTDGDILTGDHLALDLPAETGRIHQGRVFFQERHFYITGENIQKTGERTYRAKRVRVTTCDPDQPDWQISGRDLKVTVEGYGSLRGAAFWAGRVPLAYVPYLFFPVKIKRQTGFLVPAVEYSDRKWESVELPFFWAINDHSDMTVTAHHMGRRGEKLGLEYRRVSAPDSRLTVMLDFFEDNKINDQPDDEYGFDSDAYLRPNRDRYWLRMKQDHDLGAGVTAKVDIDFVSDQDYLLEFEEGYTGFDKTDNYFEARFGRDLDDYTSQTRINQAALHKGWGQYSLNAGLRWHDNVVERRWSETDDTAQQLPEVEFDALKQQLGPTPFYYDLDSEYLYCFRQDGTRGHRADIHPRLYLPLQAGNVFSLEPSVGFRETVWQIDTYDGTNPGAAQSRSRSVYDTRLELASEIYRVFAPGGPRGQTRLKHTLVPEMVHEYVPRVDQAGYPIFDDELDRIAGKNLVTYGITNTFVLRQSRPGTEEAPAAARYRRVALFKIEQSYDIQEAREDDPALWSDPDERQPLSPVRMELVVHPLSKLVLDTDAAWNVYDNAWDSYNAELRWHQNRSDREEGSYFEVAYRYRRDISEAVVLDMQTWLTKAFAAYVTHERNLHNHIDIETGFGVIYQSGCWSLELGYVDTDDDRRYTFMINLLGLGGVGSEISGSDLESPH